MAHRATSTRCARARSTAAIWNKTRFGQKDGRVKLRGCLLVAIRMRIAVGTAWTQSVRINIPRPSASDRIMVAGHRPNGTEERGPRGQRLQPRRADGYPHLFAA